ncbi:MAG: hypothetical protein FWD73_16110 [Polyangiaceae bacterium]|nr:hypothetical protein [Polyangiaceae bacterium]
MVKLPTIRIFRSSFWLGFASVLDIMGVLGPRMVGSSTAQYDRTTVGDDWAAVKKDLQIAWRTLA